MSKNKYYNQENGIEPHEDNIIKLPVVMTVYPKKERQKLQEELNQWARMYAECNKREQELLLKKEKLRKALIDSIVWIEEVSSGIVPELLDYFDDYRKVLKAAYDILDECDNEN